MKTNRFSESFANADAVFNGMYSAELKQLKGLSKEEINAIVPASNSMQTYQAMQIQIFLPMKLLSAYRRISIDAPLCLTVNVLPMDLFHLIHRFLSLPQLLQPMYHQHLQNPSPPLLY